jgi:hypothetical protein
MISERVPLYATNFFRQAAKPTESGSGTPSADGRELDRNSMATPRERALRFGAWNLLWVEKQSRAGAARE